MTGLMVTVTHAHHGSPDGHVGVVVHVDGVVEARVSCEPTLESLVEQLDQAVAMRRAIAAVAANPPASEEN